MKLARGMYLSQQYNNPEEKNQGYKKHVCANLYRLQIKREVQGFPDLFQVFSR